MTFDQWMNRPLARVQVYVWAVARRIYGEPLMRFVCLPGYRDSEVLEQRKTIAGAIRIARRGKINLPFYNEATGNYSFEK